MNETMVTMTGWVAGEITQRRFEGDSQVTRFRMVSRERRYDPETKDWVDGHSIFVDVQCWDRFGENVATDLKRGDPVLVHGRLRCREFEHEGVQRVALEVRATAVGRNLRFTAGPDVPLSLAA
ncbi:single-stranded DNA-binding protein [Actinokineospora sp. PR83]|uniref:single-stranded DNA-binding protein n=1 Tax=Actinokineospora sp. PR83 TaxID=2884908 RepID=UPI0027DF9A4A|nr:single-stranded DNA-binding protein [Actinokineospora sp. PR83]MCG8917114.1 single-stranded DNA-binding protein [Actinokineospora sp. PR83]